MTALQKFDYATAPVMVLHGTANSSAQWRQLDALLRGGRQVIAPDICGYGPGAGSELGRDIGMRPRLRALVEKLGMLDSPVHLVGHSFGGAMALKLAEMMPQLVLSVCIYEPTALGVFRHCESSVDAELLRSIQQLADLVESAPPRVAMENFINFWMGGSHWQTLPLAAQEKMASYATIAARDFRDALAELDADTESQWFDGPVQVMVGGATVPIATRIAQLLQQRLTNAHLVVCEGLGHMGPIMQAGAFNNRIIAYHQSVDFPH